MQRVREAERERQYNEYKDRIGEIVVGEVKRVEHGNVLVDLGRAEAIVRRDDLIPRELFRTKDRIRAFLYDVRHEIRGPQLFLSRTHPGFMAKLFEQEVPEIYDGIIEIKALARDPGSRAKIAVISKDSSIDPVGRLRRHARLAASRRWSRSWAARRSTSFPGRPTRPPSSSTRWRRPRSARSCSTPRRSGSRSSSRTSMQHIAIGRRGQNVRLASQLTGWDIDIVSDTEDRERRQREFRELTEHVHGRAERRGGDRPAARHRGLHARSRTWPITETEELAGDPGLRRGDRRGAQGTRPGLSRRGRADLARRGGRARHRRGPARATTGSSLPTIVELGRKGVKTLEDLADLAADELVELVPPEAGLDVDARGRRSSWTRGVRLGWIEDEPTPT